MAENHLILTISCWSKTFECVAQLFSLPLRLLFEDLVLIPLIGFVFEVLELELGPEPELLTVPMLLLDSSPEPIILLEIGPMLSAEQVQVLEATPAP